MPQGFSNELKDFVTKCLNSNPNKRSSVEEMLTHPWIKRVESRYVENPFKHE